LKTFSGDEIVEDRVDEGIVTGVPLQILKRRMRGTEIEFGKVKWGAGIGGSNFLLSDNLRDIRDVWNGNI